jgi:cysteine-rich repeat protein
MSLMRSIIQLGLLGVVFPACFYEPSGSGPLGGTLTSTGPTTASVLTGEGEGSIGVETGVPTGVISGDTTGVTSSVTTSVSSVDTTDDTTAGDETSTGPPPATCGDGIVDAGEACDDGNSVDNDACTNACKLADCGDAIVGPGETCDDGNSVDNDACSNACVPCGDGVVQPPEECDDGGETAACDANCTLVACGDGTHNAIAQEECDDGNLSPGDACSSTCEDTKIEQIALGEAHTCVRFAEGGVRCWGSGAFGATGHEDTETLGDNDMPNELPTPNLKLGGAATDLAAGFNFTCATVGGAVHCWGQGSKGQLGSGNSMNSLVMPPAALDLGLGTTTVQIDTYYAHTCAVLLDKTMRCWGAGQYGALGSGNENNVGDDPPPEMPPLEIHAVIQAKQVATGKNHTCVLLVDGSVRCWGRNNFGQLGQGSTDTIGLKPEDIPPVIPTLLGLDEQDGKVKQISAGLAHNCALMESGNVRCWGYGNSGRLGTGDTTNIGDQPGDGVPKDVDLGGVLVLQVGVGDAHSCALLANGLVKCWGSGAGGVLGYGNPIPIFDPADAPMNGVALGAPGDTAVLLAVGQNHSCALLSDDTLRCWGQNTFGQLGYGNTDTIGDGETPASAGPVPF